MSENKRVYLAGPWIDREKIPPIAKQLESLGYDITHKWWLYEGESQEKEGLEFLRQCAIADVNGVATSDLVLVYNSAKSEGKAAEQGIAIALRKPIVCITGEVKPSSNIFHYLPQYTHVKTVDEAIEKVKEILG